MNRSSERAANRTAIRRVSTSVRREQLKTKNLKGGGIGGEDLAHTRGPENSRKLGVQDAFAAKLMPLHQVEEQDGGVITRKDVSNLSRVPPIPSCKTL